MTSNEEYRRQIMNDLAQGNVESFDDLPKDSAQEYHSFDDFAQRSSVDERRQIFGQSLHPSRIPLEQMEPELQQAIAKIKPDERDDVAREFFKRLRERGLDERHLQQTLSLSTHDAKRMNADDVSKLVSFTYHSYPEVFQDVLAEKPAILRFLSNPLVAGVFGIIAARWLSNRRS